MLKAWTFWVNHDVGMSHYRSFDVPLLKLLVPSHGLGESRSTCNRPLSLYKLRQGAHPVHKTRSRPRLLPASGPLDISCEQLKPNRRMFGPQGGPALCKRVHVDSARGHSARGPLDSEFPNHT